MAEELIVEEAAKEVVDLAVETAAGVSKVALVIGGACVGYCIGAVVGYIFAKKSLEADYNQRAEDEIAEMRAHYLAKEKASEQKKPLDEVIAEAGYTESEQAVIDEVVAQEEEAEEAISVFKDYKDNWDYDVEVPNRQDDVPYVIHKDEYFNAETGYEQITLTYFEGDDVLSDSNDTPIDDQDAMVCLGNLGKFGHGSGDPNVVYVRNVELELEIEIVHSDGLYSEEVHGIPDDELKHSNRRKRRQSNDN